MTHVIERSCALCPRTIAPKSRTGLCSKCYMRYYRNGKQVPASPPRRDVPPRTPTCHPDAKHAAGGLCAPCYQSKKRTELRGRPPAAYRQSPECHPDRKHHAYGFCKPCYLTSELRKDQYTETMKNPEKRTAAQVRTRTYKLRKLYGLTLDEYDQMLRAQNGVCAICKVDKPAKNRLAVDHDHITGAVRGLLCTPCNRSIGYLENTSWMNAAQRYLLLHK